MDKKSAQLKVGIFSLIGIFLFFFLIIWGKGLSFSRNTYSLFISFPSAAGLLDGDPVTIRGVHKGRVEKIFLQENDVLVRIAINNSVKVYSDATAFIENLELMGGKKIELNPGNGNTLLKENDMIIGENLGGIIEMAPVIMKLGDNIRGIVSKLDTTISAVNKALKNTERFDKLDRIIDNLEGSTKSLNDFMKDNKNNLSKIISNVNESSESLNEIFTEKREKIAGSVDRLVDFSYTLDSLTLSISRVVQKIEKGEGTLGKLIYDDDIYLKLKNTAVELDSVANTVKKNLTEFLKRTNIQLIKIF